MPTHKFPGRYESLSKISELVTRAAKKAGLDDSEVYAVQLAVDEACSNIIEHAYGGEGQGDIECMCRVTEEGLEITLYDRGRPFRPETIPDPKINVPLEKLQPRGAGLFLMKKLMDRVDFQFKPNSGNILKMFKRASKK